MALAAPRVFGSPVTYAPTIHELTHKGAIASCLRTFLYCKKCCYPCVWLSTLVIFIRACFFLCFYLKTFRPATNVLGIVGRSFGLHMRPTQRYSSQRWLNLILLLTSSFAFRQVASFFDKLLRLLTTCFLLQILKGDFVDEQVESDHGMSWSESIHIGAI